ncbi:MAG TPA: sensor histidine kinase [Kineosporiaceae bacterium]|nr:sensor histidine kinase [Kineosporiaceae bacterium]
MRVPRLRTDPQYLPLILRAVLLLLCALVTSLLPSFGPGMAVMPALLLLLVAALASIPVGPGLPKQLQALAETLGAALIVGTLHGRADLFIAYLFVPLIMAGLNGGLPLGLTAAGMASAALLLSTSLSTFDVQAGRTSQLTPAMWAPMLVAVTLVAAWSRRVIGSVSVSSEPAYADAHRLLSELHVVARQLSLGLDPQTLAAALAEDVTGVVTGVRATVLVRSSGGRFVPLVGQSPTPFAESVLMDAWLAADLVRRSRNGVTVAAMPVRMGERVVAVVVLAGNGPIEDDQIARCRKIVAQAGTRLASALLFDDVRRLATDDERLRLAREIHDGIAQDLASVGYLVDDIASEASPEVADRLAALREHVTGLVGELRLSIFDLRTGVDESVGLARTLAEYVQRVGTQSGLTVHVATEGPQHRLPVATEVEILRIVQEAVTNVRRHAEAKNLSLSVVVAPPHACVTVTDDGRGLGRGRPDSMGITGMKERARRIGARLRVESVPDGRGTLVEIVLDGANHRSASDQIPTATGRHASVADSTFGAPDTDPSNQEGSPSSGSARPRDRRGLGRAVIRR